MKHTFGAFLARLLCLALCLLMLASLAACGSDKEPEAVAEPTQDAEPTPVPTPTPTPAPTPTVESLSIYYMGEPILNNDCTAKVGETLPLSVVCIPGGIAGEVLWSVDPLCADSFELTVNETDPYRATLRCVSVLPDGAGGAKINADFYGASASITIHVLPGEGGITSLNRASEDQTVEIHRARGDYAMYDFTITPGYETRLSAVPLKGGDVEDVIWSMDEEAAKILCFTPSGAHPGQMILECFGTPPAGVAYVEIYAELDGVKTTCRVRIEG